MTVLVHRRAARSISFVLCIVLLASACVAPALSPPSARLAAVRRIAVVPVEPPPLLATDPIGRTSIGAEILANTVIFAPVAPGATAVVLLGGIIMLIEWVGAPKTPSSATLSEMINKGIAWSPTRELADEAASQLRSSGNTRDIATANEYRVLALESRSTTWHMENWYRPIREWYADDGPVLSYKNQYPGDAVVVEIGLLNWEWHTNRLVVQVMMRLIDVDSGRVIGRARHAAFPMIGRAAEVLSADNAVLKRIFLETARPLIEGGLRDLRLGSSKSANGEQFHFAVV